MFHNIPINVVDNASTKKWKCKRPRKNENLTACVVEEVVPSRPSKEVEGKGSVEELDLFGEEVKNGGGGCCSEWVIVVVIIVVVGSGGGGGAGVGDREKEGE